MHTDRERLAVLVSVQTIVCNAVLSAFKLFAGVAAHSGAMFSDAVHSISDVVSTVVVIVGVKLGAKAADRGHPYGHERMECVAAVVLSMLLASTGFGIGYTGINALLANGAPLKEPGMLALVAALVSIVVKEAMYWYTRWAAKKIKSDALLADAWHHRSDALSSVGSFAGILGARVALPQLDPIASVVICIFIIKAAVRIFRDAIDKMIDRACDDETVQMIQGEIEAQTGVLGIDRLRTRLFGDRIFVDVEIRAASGLTLEQGHHIAHEVHDAVERRCTRVKHCMVHVNPGELIHKTNETAQE